MTRLQLGTYRMRYVNGDSMYRIRYDRRNVQQHLLANLRLETGMTYEQLADVGGTSRTAVSAWANGRRSPTLETFTRLLEAVDCELAITPKVKWSKVTDPRTSKRYDVPDRLWRLPLSEAFRAFSFEGQTYDLRNGQHRFTWYETVISDGDREAIEEFIDGALLIEMWSDLVLPSVVRRPWQEAIDASVVG